MLMSCPADLVARQGNGGGGGVLGALWTTGTKVNQRIGNTRKATTMPRIPPLRALCLASQCVYSGGGTEDPAQNMAYQLLGDITQVEVTAAPPSPCLSRPSDAVFRKTVGGDHTTGRAEESEQLRLLAEMAG